MQLRFTIKYNYNGSLPENINNNFTRKLQKHFKYKFNSKFYHEETVENTIGAEQRNKQVD